MRARTDRTCGTEERSSPTGHGTHADSDPEVLKKDPATRDDRAIKQMDIEAAPPRVRPSDPNARRDSCRRPSRRRRARGTERPAFGPSRDRLAA